MHPVLQPYTGDVAALKQVYAEYPSGLSAIGAHLDGEDVVMIASSFTVGVSYEPPLCSVAVQKSSETWPRLQRAERIGVSALSAGHAASVRQMASRTRENRLAGLEIVRTDTRALLLGGAGTWLECAPVAQHEAGDHVIVLLQVLSTFVADGAQPLVLHRGRVHRPVPVEA